MSEPVAIVGAAVRFPGAETLDAYWELLISGRSAVTEIPDGRWAKSAFFHPEPGQPGRSYTWAAGVLPRPGAFDAAFFGISPREADQVDPQQRLLLELAWEAMEDAGIPPSRLGGSRTGVFVGASGTEYGNLATADPAAGNAYFMTGTNTGVAANRLSYVFDLRGPSFIVDTACSSSLVALHQACQAIRSGEVEAALAGGVNMLMSPYPFAGFCSAGMLSPDGRCFAFDARANGYVRAEGAGLVLLKPLRQALTDGDAIRAVIRGTGLNSDGRTMGLSLPSGEAQARLLRQVYDGFEVDAEELGFVEAHGTGTAAGDPIEVGALGRELGCRRTRPLPIGSAKTNVGHLEVASGMAGLAKAMLALEHRTAPSSLNYETGNPHIDFADLNVEVLTRPAPLAEGELTVGVNSFGFGGANAHAVLSAAPARPAAAPAHAGPLPPLLISARSEAALHDLAAAWAERLAGRSGEDAAADIRAAARRRDHHRHRASAWGVTPGDLAAALRAPAVEHLRGGWTDGRAATGRLAYVFTGNGAQYAGMARDALAHSPAFARAVAEADAALSPLLGWSVLERLQSDEPPEVLARTDVAQPLLFAVQVGVVRALEAAGVRPDAVTGHSVGEIAAAWACGALTMEQACRVVTARSRQQQRTAGRGRMAALALGRNAALDALQAVDPRLELAAENSASATTVAGPVDALARLGEAAKAEGWRCTPLALDYAFHSAAMEPIRDDLLAELADLRPAPSALPFVSAVEGAAIPGEALGAEYWWRNIRERVRFHEAARALVDDGVRVFVEVGPHAILQSYLRETLKGADVEGRVLSTLAKRQSPRDPFVAAAARLYAAGADLAGAPAYDGPATERGLPGVPWRRTPHWLPWTGEKRTLSDASDDGALLGSRAEAEGGVWTRLLDVRLQPWLADHALEGQPLLPAAAMAEIALAAARTRFPDAEVLEAEDLEILRALPLEPGRTRELRVRLGEDRRLVLESRARLSDEPWGVHATARVAAGGGGPPAPLDAPSPEAVLDGEAVYAAAARLGLDYGPAFRPVARVELDGRDGAVVRFEADGPVAPGQIVPAERLDGAMQGLLALAAAEAADGRGESLLPSRMGRVRLHAPFDRTPVSAAVRITRRGVRSVRAEIVLHDAEGAALAEVRDAWFRRVRLRGGGDPASRTFLIEPAPAPLRAAPWTAGLSAERLAALAGASGPADRDATDLLEAYLVAGVHEAVAGVAGTGPFSGADLGRTGLLAEAAAPLFGAALELLARHHLASETGGLWRLEPEHGFGDRALVWRTLIGEAPALSAELALAADTLAALPRLFRGEQDAPRPPPALLEQMLWGSPAARGAQGALVRAAAEIAATRPAGRPLRVLELSGTGVGLSARLLRALAPCGGALAYTLGEATAEAAARAGRLADGRPELRVETWDPSTGAPPPGAFDLVVSAYGLSRLRLGARGLEAVRAALSPGGVLLSVEPEPSPLLDLVLGRDPDWWSAGASPDFPVSPLRDRVRWTELLEAAGLEQAAAATVSATPWGATLLTARAPEATEVEGATPPPFALLCDWLAPLAAALAARGGRPGLEAAGGDPPVIVILPPSEGPAAARGGALLDAVRAVADRHERARLLVVVRGAGRDPAEAALAGLVRTLANEHPELDPRLLDIDPALGADTAADAVLAELAAGSDEGEIVLAAEGRFAPRLRQGPPVTAATGGALRLEAAQPGLLSTLAWIAAPERSPGPGEVAIRVEASGLNFRDVMWAQGLLPEEALLDGFAGATLGLECAGVVTAVGAGVEHLAPGDRAMAFAPAALSSHVVTAAHAAVRLPEGMSFADAATVPVAFLTVVYALGRVARLGAGERVLIHGGAGGVGLAAIQFAQAQGAEVFATAGSDAKRELLRQMGADHVLDSRSLAFAEEVRSLTGGVGVDVVLNSLAGEAMERSLGLLRPFGRFLELGKRDFFENTRVGLRPLRENVSYHAIDADRLPLQRPELAADLLAETLRLMEEGALRPLPFRAFDRAEAEDAFRLMQSAGHFGKIVLTPDPLAVVQPSPARELRVRDDRTYLVTGGLSGFGLAAARWLAARGARRLALLGRRGAETPGAAEALAAFAAAGVRADAYAADVADAEALAAVLAQVRAEGPPLGGMVHAAMTVEDGLLRDMDEARLGAAFSAKLDGALNLDALTRDDPVELCLLFSSATTVLGAPGQGAYVAANLGLEALAARREAKGRPSLAVGWGPIADVGFLARETAALDALERRLSATPLASAEALDALPALWASGAPALTYAAVHWDAARKRLPVLSRPMFAGLAAGETAEDGDLAERLAGLGPEEAKALVVEVLLEEVARILSASSERVDAHRPLSELGMDSLMAVELRMTLESRLGVSLPLLSLSDTTTVAALAGRIASSLGEGANAPAVSADLAAAALRLEAEPPARFRPEATAAE